MHNGEFGVIDGVKIAERRVIPDGRGRVMHGIKRTDPGYLNFDIQEVYCSWIYPDAIKAWHLHKSMTLNYLVPVGNLKLVLYDPRPDSLTYCQLDEIYLGENTPHRIVQIPKGIWNGFMAVGGNAAMVVSIADEVHLPDEILRQDIDQFSQYVYAYDWYASLRG